MAFGAFAPLPLRLGGSAEEGWAARFHARMAADLVAAKRIAPLAVFTYTKTGSIITILSYLGQNGAGLAFAPDTVGAVGSGATVFSWSTRSFSDPYGIAYPVNVKSGKATVHGAASARGVVTVFANGVTVTSVNSSGAGFDAKVTVKLF